MAKTKVATVQSLKRTGFEKFLVDFGKNWQLHLMIIVPVIYMIIFHYVPLLHLKMAFQEYKPKQGLLNSQWVGLGQFLEFFKYHGWLRLIGNTMGISLYNLAASFPIPIVLALVIHVNTIKPLKKIAQNVSYVPHFISLVILIGILNTVLNPISGLPGVITTAMGKDYMKDIRYSAEAFRHLYVWSGVWQGMGWASIIYVSALSAVPDDLHEAAKLDGASRLRRVWSVDLPTILPTIAIMLIMRFGSIMSVGYQKAWLMRSKDNLVVSEIISTYVFQQGIGSGKGEYSYSSAVGLMNSVVNTSMTVLVNWITNVLTDNEMGLF